MHDDWKRIEIEAREQVAAAIKSDEETPLEFGRSIAWAECRFGRTNDLSLVHRVGLPVFDDARTLCGDRVPPAVLRVALSPNLIHTLGRCRYCETAYQQKSQQSAHTGAAA